MVHKFHTCQILWRNPTKNHGTVLYCTEHGTLYYSKIDTFQMSIWYAVNTAKVGETKVHCILCT